MQKADEIQAAPEEFVQKIEQAPLENFAAPNTDPTTLKIEKPTSEKELRPVPGAPRVSPPSKPSRQKRGSKLVQPESLPGWTPTHWPFGPGERSVYALSWSGIEAGWLTLEVQEPKILESRPVLHLVGSVKSSRVLDLIYKVDDRIQSWVTLDHFLPLRQEIEQNESNVWGRRVVVFDQKTHRVKFYSNVTKKGRKTKETRREDDATPFAQDIFGALFFYRFANDLNSLRYPIHDRWKNWNLETQVVGKETLTTPAGVFDTVRLRVFPRVEGQLKPQGDVELWVSDDAYRTMIQFRAKIRVGAIRGVLQEYRAGRQWTVPTPRLLTPLSGS